MRKLNLFFCVLLTVFSLSCNEKIHRVSRPLLGTIVNLTMIGDSTAAARASSAAFKEIERIENMMSPYRKGSDIQKIRYSNGDLIEINDETWMLVDKSIRFSRETNGAFDISFASLSSLWNFKSENFRPPVKREVQGRLRLVDFKKIILRNEYRIMVPRGMRIGLGGIAKGYAIARASYILKKYGIKNAIVEEGGDLQVLGNKFGKPWKTGIMHPRDKTLIAVLKMHDGESIATSGDYERFKKFKGKRYHHILDPRTGYPAESFISVSVLSKDPVMSDAYATAFSVMKLKELKRFLKKHSDLGVILVDKKMKIYITENIKKRLETAPKLKIEWIK
jgi:thiamine biosynthesis lipoprotein